MTCIIGLKDDKTGKVYMGADSAASNGQSVTIRKDSKLFCLRNIMLIGYTDSYRMGQLLQYELNLPVHIEGLDVMEYVVSLFVPEVRKSLQRGGWMSTKEGREESGHFLIGYKNRLFEIASDMHVSEPVDGIEGIGSGYKYAMGAMYALGTSVHPRTRIQRSLEIAAHLAEGVRSPFIIEEI